MIQGFPRDFFKGDFDSMRQLTLSVFQHTKASNGGLEGHNSTCALPSTREWIS